MDTKTKKGRQCVSATWFATAARLVVKGNRDYSLASARLAFLCSRYALGLRGTAFAAPLDMRKLEPEAKAFYLNCLRRRAYPITRKWAADAKQAALRAYLEAERAALIAAEGPARARLITEIQSLDMANHWTADNRAERARLAAQLEAA